VEALARLGYASKAVIYGIVGVLAILTAFNVGGRITDTSGALRVVLTQPYGRALLLVLAVGLCGYAAWRLLDSLVDPDGHGRDARGLTTRIGNVVRGAVYGALGIDALRLFRGMRATGGDAETWTARAFDLPLGWLAVGAIGVTIAVYGLFELAASIRGKSHRKVDWSVFAPDVRPALQRIARFGVAIRATIIVTLGVFLLRAAITHDPTEAAGTRESVLKLGSVIQGRWLLALIAAGLLAYAVDQFVHARCRRVRPVL
jgi:hypothetical protein